MNLDIIILILLAVGALAVVMTADLLKSAVGLAAVSAILSILMFRLAAPLAAVFELSVCAGLITVVFISVIGLTRPGVKDAPRRSRYFIPPLILLIVLLGFYAVRCQPDPVVSTLLPCGADVRKVLWEERALDLLGQVAVLLAGVFGVVVLFKERQKKKEDGGGPNPKE
ncbi:MAG: hypothetical protein PHP98_01925 [Kiritimatiellae bacterium]|nr:hypothetical protein [Kiritimatiellia bacterium]